MKALRLLAGLVLLLGPPPAWADSFDVVLPASPPSRGGLATPEVTLRLRVEVGGESVVKTEADFLRDWFRICDRSGTGKLDAAAIRRALLHNPIRQLVPAEQVQMRDLGLEGPASATIADLVVRYQRQPRGRFLVLDAPPALPPYADLLTDALGRCLDRDGDGKLSRAELESAERVLLEAFDLDGDECLTPLEIVPGLLNSVAPGQVGRLARPVSLVPVGAEGERKPTVELLVRLGEKQAQVAPARSQAETGARWLGKHGSLLLDVQAVPFGGAPLLDRSGSRQTSDPNGSLATSATEVPGRTELMRLFRQADPSNRGHVLLDDLKGREQYPLRMLHRPADCDGDGRLTAGELEQYLALRDRAAAGMVTLAVLPRQRGWFELLDRDRDGRLGRRELRRAWEALAGPGTSSTDTLPLTDLKTPAFHLTLVPGPARPPGVVLAPPLVPRRGPAWFLALDRNGDGDLSWREFAGTQKQFRYYDRDGDGLISAEEAVAGDARLQEKAK
jgi:Ca2+-binding EF-hand superfamily protein